MFISWDLCSLSVILLVLVRQCGVVMRGTVSALSFPGFKSQLGCFLVVGFPASYFTSPSLSSHLCKTGENNSTSPPGLLLALLVSICKLLNQGLSCNKHYIHVLINHFSSLISSSPLSKEVSQGTKLHVAHDDMQNRKESVGGGQSRT